MIKLEDVSIVIPHLGGSPESEYALTQCFTSLIESGWDRNRIIIVKNGQVCKDHGFEIEIKSQGQCKAVNAAAATVNTPWIFVSNDDMVYAPGWFETLTRNEDRVLCVSPKLVEPRQGAPTFETYFCGGAGGNFDKQKWLDYAKQERKTGTQTGFNLPFLISKELWDTIGGYDVNYDPWGSNSDSDLEYKIRLAGIQPLQDTRTIVYHFSQTSGTFHPDNQTYWQKNWDYFIGKWGFPRTDEGIWEANFHLPTTDEGRKFKPDWEAVYGPVNK